MVYSWAWNSIRMSRYHSSKSSFFSTGLLCSSFPFSVLLLMKIGSHYDTVIDGGRFDGALGVLAGIAAVKNLNRRGIETTVPIDVVAFSDEEGVRFHSAFLGSRAMVGTLATDRQSTVRYNDLMSMVH